MGRISVLAHLVCALAVMGGEVSLVTGVLSWALPPNLPP
jgi:hypothetical protein